MNIEHPIAQAEDKHLFFITGLPRSRTAWLANLFTWRDSFCLHDGLKHGLTAMGLVRAMLTHEEHYVGDADSGLLLFWPKLQEMFPRARWVLIHRDPKEAQESYETHFWKRGGYVGASEPGTIRDVGEVFALLETRYAQARLNLNMREFEFEALDDPRTIREMWEWLTPANPFHEERAAMLDDLAVNLIPEKAEVVWQ